MPSIHGDLRREQSALFLDDSLGVHIRNLTVARWAAYDRARALRRRGQLVPASLDQEMRENGLQLRQALVRYAEATGATQR